MARILPRPTPTSQPYWDGCCNDELLLQTCRTCNQSQFYPRIVCSFCQSKDLDWQPASGSGWIASFTIMHHSISGDYPTPLVAALVDLAEGPRMMTHIVGPTADTAKVGDAVSVTFEQWDTDYKMPVFTLDQHEERS